MAGESAQLKEAFDEFKEFREQMKNPLVVGAMLHRLSEEKASSNLVLREINAKLDRLLSLEERMARLEAALAAPAGKQVQENAVAKAEFLPEIDASILEFVQKSGKACAEQVMAQFNYKGSNAASSRLNRMAREGLLRKIQVGRKVYFVAQKTS
ncbi:MAG: hypothetical protein V1708_01165 [Candidatus Micrarchaeota archaeon]